MQEWKYLCTCRAQLNDVVDCMSKPSWCLVYHVRCYLSFTKMYNSLYEMSRTSQQFAVFPHKYSHCQSNCWISELSFIEGHDMLAHQSIIHQIKGLFENIFKFRYSASYLCQWFCVTYEYLEINEYLNRSSTCRSNTMSAVS